MGSLASLISAGFISDLLSSKLIPKHRLDTKVFHIAAQCRLLSVQGSYLEMAVQVSLVLIQSQAMQTRRQRGMALHCTGHSQALQWSVLEFLSGEEKEAGALPRSKLTFTAFPFAFKVTLQEVSDDCT